MPVHLIPRSLCLCLGLAILSLGVVFSIRSNLGTSPVSSLPYVYSFIVPLSVGTVTVIFHAFMIALQYLVLKYKFHWSRCLQILVGAVLGLMIDALLFISQSWQPDHYFTQLFFCFLSCILTAIGIIFILKANLIYLAIEGFYEAVSNRYHIAFSRCKTIGDICMVSIALISGLIFTQQAIGVREGTIITALVVGSMIHWIVPYFRFIDRWVKAPH